MRNADHCTKFTTATSEFCLLYRCHIAILTGHRIQQQRPGSAVHGGYVNFTSPCESTPVSPDKQKPVKPLHTLVQGWCVRGEHSCPWGRQLMVGHHPSVLSPAMPESNGYKLWPRCFLTDPQESPAGSCVGAAGGTPAALDATAAGASAGLLLSQNLAAVSSASGEPAGAGWQSFSFHVL